LGFYILILVNFFWVLSGELTRFVFIDSHFNRPFFVLCFKSSLLSLYYIIYLCKPVKIKYTELEEEIELSIEGFELMSDGENENCLEGKLVRFSSTKEIRRLPHGLAMEAQLARRSYSSSSQCSFPSISSPTLIILFLLLPLWLICSLTYQTSLLYTSVSSLNLLSASSSVFVLILSICLPSSHSKATPLKGLVVLINLLGVSLVSQSDSNSLIAIFLAVFSAFAYALYLISITKFVSMYRQIDINFLLGSIGLVSIGISLFLLPFLDWTSIESLHPLPSSAIWFRLILSTVLGTLIADRLWMEATLLTSSLVSSLSTSLSIPISFLMDSLLRQEYPGVLQLIAAIPITISFIGATLLEEKMDNLIDEESSLEDSSKESLIDNEHL
ncbi:hypothetical protein PENTCL1PPCAC_22816, partial [Pristionchus entomophagus]